MEYFNVTIDRGVPIPTFRRITFLDVCRKMEVGDSFEHHYQRGVTDVNRKLAPKRFYCGKHGNAYRVWRIE